MGALLAALWAAVLGTSQVDAQESMTVVIEVRDGAYVPRSVEVLAGDVLEFRWVGQEPHSVHGPTLEGLDSHPLCQPSVPLACAQPGEAPYRWEVRGEPGRHDYVDRASDGAQAGTIVIARPAGAPAEPTTEPSSTDAPAQEPSATPAPQPSGSGGDAGGGGGDADGGDADGGQAAPPSPAPSPAAESPAAPPSPIPTPGQSTRIRQVPAGVVPDAGALLGPQVADPVEPDLEPFPAPAEPGAVPTTAPLASADAVEIVGVGDDGVNRLVPVSLAGTLLVGYVVVLRGLLRRPDLL